MRKNVVEEFSIEYLLFFNKNVKLAVDLPTLKYFPYLKSSWLSSDRVHLHDLPSFLEKQE